MANATQVLAAFREMIANKNLSRDDLHDLIKDGIMAALARRYGPTVEAEIRIDEEAGDMIIKSLSETIGAKTVTYDFARLMEGATKVKCSEFADEMIKRMK